MAANKAVEQLDQLQQMINDVLIQTGKALKAASKSAGDHDRHMGEGTRHPPGKLDSGLGKRIRAVDDSFNFALDDMELEIIRAKAVLQRDLYAVRRKERALQNAAGTAPPATDAALPADETSSQLTAAMQHQEAPVAPFPDMNMSIDIDMFASPEPVPASLPPVPTETAVTDAGAQPSPSQEAPSATSAQPADARPVSAPSRKETKVPLPQFPRSAQQTPKPIPTPAMAPPVALASEPPLGSPSAAAQPSLSIATTSPAPKASSTPATEPALGFTNMTFTLAPPLNDEQSQAAKAEGIDLTALGSTDNGAELIDLDGLTDADLKMADAAPMPDLTQPAQNTEQNTSDADATNLDELFNLDSATVSNMDLDLSLAQDNSNFDDLFISGDTNFDGADLDTTSFSFD